MNQKALYYPYIHIRNIRWLKATLLLFSEVQRMVPDRVTPKDNDEVEAFTNGSSGRPALLTPAMLWTPRALSAQEALASRLRTDAQKSGFLSHYGRYSARQSLKPGDYGFQIHQGKLHRPLQEALRDTGLAWQPSKNPKPYDVETANYVELHPDVGEVVMSTLALAVATGQGLDIVGDQRSGSLHRCLLEKNAESIYDAWLHPSAVPPAPVEPRGEELFEFLIGFPCDLREVTPDGLAALQDDREPLRRLVTRLQELAKEIPAMDPGPERETYFHDIGAKVLKEWQFERSNMSTYWRKFFGEGLADKSEKFLEKVAEKLTSGAEKAATGGAAGATAAAASGVGVATMATAAITGAGVGLAIGVIYHGVKSYFRMRRDEQDSPYRYLTLMEQAGVVFRSEPG
jgi:hypothetical protein